MVEGPESSRPTLALVSSDDDDEEITAKAPELRTGTDVGGYLIEGELGRGGMGVVYAATHPVIGKRAAIKVLRSEVSRSAVTVERFIQEARAVNQIGHRNIVDIFAFGTLPDGRAYHVMDLLVGEPLRKRVKRGPLHPSEAASVLDEIASALIAAHDKGFIHRDLKPDNIFLVAQDGRWPEVKLLDFGLAKLMPEGGVAKFQTKAGVMLGTPEYMSPEQARGDAIDYRADIYALGILTFEILTGRRPFTTAGGAFAMLQAQIEEEPPNIGELVPGLPDELVQLVDAMLAKDREARPRLAAVRTVLKRLRSTQLPSMSVAGLEMAVRTSTLPPGVTADARPDPRTVRVGPGQRRGSPAIATPEPIPRPSPAPLPAPPPPGSQPMPVQHQSQRHSSQPPHQSQPIAAQRQSQPFQPAERPSAPQIPHSNPPAFGGDFSHQHTPPPPSTAGVPTPPPRSIPPQNARFPPTYSSPGSSPAIATTPYHAQTRLGVGAPQQPPPPQAARSATALVAQPPTTSWVWLVLGAAAFIGAGIALALILMR